MNKTLLSLAPVTLVAALLGGCAPATMPVMEEVRPMTPEEWCLMKHPMDPEECRAGTARGLARGEVARKEQVVMEAEQNAYLYANPPPARPVVVPMPYFPGTGPGPHWGYPPLFPPPGCRGRHCRY